MTDNIVAIAENNNKTKYFVIGSLAIGTATFLGIKIFKIKKWYNALKINISGKIHNYRNGNNCCLKSNNLTFSFIAL